MHTCQLLNSLNLKFNDECLKDIQEESKKHIEKEKKNNKCKKCQTSIMNKSTFCIKCFQINSRIVERPLYSDLIKDVEKLGYSATGRKYGVSDNAIRKWIKCPSGETVNTLR